MFCTNCGNKLDDDAIFCQNCGKKVSDDSKLICGHCGAQLDEDSVFCSKCGKQVKQTPVVEVLENPTREESPSPVVDSSTTDKEEEKEAKPEEKSRKTETILERLLKDEKTSHSAELQFKIGQCYYNGTDGTTVNYEQAMKWFVKAAYQEHAKAQNNLGIMYENGYGTEKDLSLAKMWYKKAADHGIVFARVSFEKLENDTNSHSQQNSYYPSCLPGRYMIHSDAPRPAAPRMR